MSRSLVEADFGFRRPLEPEHRLFDLGPRWRRAARSGHLSPPAVLAPAGHARARGGGRRSSARPVSTRWSPPCCAIQEEGSAWSRPPSGSACRARPASRAPKAWIDLPAFMHCPSSLTVTTSAGSRADRRLLRGQRPPVRDRGGPSLPGRGVDRESRHAVGRDACPRRHAGRHPRPGWCRVPGRVTLPTRV